MSLLPYFFDNNPWGSRNWPSRLMDQDFGITLTPDDLLTSSVCPYLSRDYFRPWRQMVTSKDLGSSIKADKDKFQVTLDVQHFKPEEVTVKTTDGFIVIEGKHEEKKDEHGYISRKFVRKYALPDGCKPESVESQLSSDGVLTVVAPRQIPEGVKGERAVPIEKTGPIRKEIKDGSAEEINGEEKK